MLAGNAMGPKLVAAALILAALAYTFVVLFVILTIVGFFGIDALTHRPLEFLIVLLLAGSPVPVWGYFLKKARGKNPKV